MYALNVKGCRIVRSTWSKRVVDKVILCLALGEVEVLSIMLDLGHVQPWWMQEKWVALTSAHRRMMNTKCEKDNPYISCWYPPCGPLGDVEALVGGLTNHVDEEPQRS